MRDLNCPLCRDAGGTLLIERPDYRIIRAHEPDYPGFCRVVWREHVSEMSALSSDQQSRLMAAVFAVERALITLYTPDKINLASLGNVVSHVHWHVIARKTDDRHFPQPVWAAPLRAQGAAWVAVSDARLREVIEGELDSGGR